MVKERISTTSNKSIRSSKFEYEWNLKLFNKSKKKDYKRLNYIGFFFLYFAISIIRIYLVVYIPVFLLEILNVDTNHLAFIQVFVYLVTFSGPLLGFLLDRYSKNKKLIISISSIIFLGSFLLSSFGMSNLGVFGLFLAINLLSQEIVKVGVSKIILEQMDTRKDGNLTAINISSNIGSFIPSIVFLFTVTNIFNVNQWYVFFFFGFLCSLPIILSLILMRENAIEPEGSSEDFDQVTISSGRTSLFNFMLLFLSYLLIWSDKLYQFPFSSWILTKFGEEGFNIYSLFYIVLILLNIGGWIIGQRISSKTNKKIKKKMSKNRFESDIYGSNQEEILFRVKLSNRKRVISITVGIYIVLTFTMAFSDFIFLMVIQGIIQVIAGVMMLNYVSLMMAISNNGKYKTFKFQCLKIAYAFSCVIFIPLGTYFSAFIKIEVLIITVGFLTIISLIPLAFLRTRAY